MNPKCPSGEAYLRAAQGDQLAQVEIDTYQARSERQARRVLDLGILVNVVTIAVVASPRGWSEALSLLLCSVALGFLATVRGRLMERTVRK